MTNYAPILDLRYAEVIAIERVKMPSAAPAGAIVGGFTGLALSQRRRPSQQLATAIGGAVLGVSRLKHWKATIWDIRID